MKRLSVRILSWHWIITFIILSAFNAWGYSDKDCVRCHEQGSHESELQLDIDQQRSTIHGREIGCSDCHQGVRDDGHIKVKGTGKVDCRECHEQKNLHAQDGSVTCVSCHTRHSIYGIEDRRSSVYWENLESTCKACHPKQSEDTNKLSFFPSLHIASHPKQDFSRIFDKRMCVGCHQGRAAHGEDGAINTQDCYMCHIPLGNNKAVLGYIHTHADWQSQPVNAVAAYISLIGFIGLILVLLYHFSFLKKM